MSHRFDAALISGAHLYGGAGLGVLGSLIPATGDSGAGYTYNDLSLPADNAKEICGRVTSWPSAGTLYAYEDASFEFSGAPDGSYSFQYQLYVDGVATGSPTAVSLSVGAVPVTISASLGAAVASGFSAGVSASTIIAASLGVATATGYQAGLSNATAILTATGVATASGFAAEISAGGEVVITCSFGSALASGYAATVSTSGPFTGSISDEDITRIVQAVLAALNATTIPVDMQKTNGVEIVGDGSSGNKFRSVLYVG